MMLVGGSNVHLVHVDRVLEHFHVLFTGYMDEKVREREGGGSGTEKMEM